MSKYLITGDRKVFVDIDYNDLDKGITKFLKLKKYSEKNFNKYGYQSVAKNEWANYQSHTYEVEAEMPTSDELEDIDGLGTGEILNWMCADAKIEPGNYIVNISW